MKKILLVLFLLLSVVVLSEEKEKTFNPSNYIICICLQFKINSFTSYVGIIQIRSKGQGSHPFLSQFINSLVTSFYYLIYFSYAYYTNIYFNFIQ